jgi:hypothetical protein
MSATQGKTEVQMRKKTLLVALSLVAAATLCGCGYNQMQQLRPGDTDELRNLIVED